MNKLFKFSVRIGFLIYVVVMIFLLFFRNRGIGWGDISLLEYIKVSSNIVPFQTIGLYIGALFDGTMNLSIPVINLFGNVLVFIPLGLFLPLIFKICRQFSALSGIMFIALLVIEVLQLLTERGSFDVDDLILNMLGICIGYALWQSKSLQRALYKFMIA